ncbi:MAG TPA: iron-regulated protein [Bacteroidales bacterium]|nr:iron-regulated protein [Bacteroidales bacterium]
MQKAKFGILVLTISLFLAFKTDKPAYQIFDKNGKAVQYEKILKASEEVDIVFFGEMHNNPISHWLQFEMTKDFYALKGKDLMLGAEMFESDNQIIIDEYFDGNIKTVNFEKELRLWNNYKTDYKPLLEFAKDSNLRFVATNVPRRYASLVNSKGLIALDSLSAKAKEFIAKLPIQYDSTLSGYKNMLESIKDSPHVNVNTPKAQALKDATMAQFILENWSDGKLFLHFNGAYHSDDFQGIVWYLLQAKPDLKILTITSVEQKEVKDLEENYKNKADFILVIPETMTKTY